MRRSIGCRAILFAAAIAGCANGTEPGDLTTVAIRPCAVNAFSPVWFAYRNGDGPWTQVTADATGLFTFEAESRASVAYSYPGPESQRVTRIVNATAPELALLGGEPCENGIGTASISGTAMTTGSGATLVSMANRTVIASLNNGQGSWALAQLPSTAADLVAVGLSQADEKWIVRRAIVPAGQTLAVLDFTSAEAQVAQSNVVSMSGGPTGGATNIEGFVRTAGGTISPMFGSSSVGTAPTFKSLAASQRNPNDVYSVAIESRNALGRDFRYVYFGYSEPADRSVVFGPAMATGTMTAVTPAPYPRMRAVVPSQAEYPDAARANFLESFRAVRVTTTAAWLGGTPSQWELEVPDLTAAGYLKEWGVSDVPRIWEVEAIKGSVHILHGGLARKDETATIGVYRVVQ